MTRIDGVDRQQGVVQSKVRHREEVEEVQTASQMLGVAEFCQIHLSNISHQCSTMLLLLSYLLPCGCRCATTAYKLNTKCNTIDQPFFTTMVMAARSNDGYTAMKQ
jgi:hypothetical protein